MLKTMLISSPAFAIKQVYRFSDKEKLLRQPVLITDRETVFLDLSQAPEAKYLCLHIPSYSSSWSKALRVPCRTPFCLLLKLKTLTESPESN